MGEIFQRDFSRGWFPSADAFNAPDNCLLRMDNCILNEEGILSLRQGSLKVNTTPLNLDVNSLHTAVINGIRYRMAGAGGAIYSNFSEIVATGFDGTGTSFLDYLGQIFFTWNVLHKKWDGATLRSWGIAKPVFTPSVAFQSPPYNQFIGDVSQWTVNEGTSALADTESGFGSALQLTPNGTTKRGTINRDYGVAANFSIYATGGNVPSIDEDTIIIPILVDDPAKLTSITFEVDVNNGDFHTDYYTFTQKKDIPVEVKLTDPQFIADDYSAEGYYRRDILIRREDRPAPVSEIKPDIPIVNKGWNRITFRRGQMSRIGSTAGKNWSTARAVRITIEGTAVIVIDVPFMQGGSSNPLNGKYKWRVAYVKDFGTYQAMSPISDLSTELECKNAAVNVFPNISGMDTQVGEIWVYRMGGTLDRFYRVAKGLADGSAILDKMSDRDALILNIPAETDNATPPDHIVDIEGPYYDRLFALTQTHLYPSKRRAPENFSVAQVIAISDVGEIAVWVKKAFGGLYIGTTKDIYRLDGTGAEFPDGTMDFVKTPLNIGNPPIASNAVSQEGNFIVYLASDGWRVFTGADSIAIRGDTDLLYKGYSRMSVPPINIGSATARFRAAIGKGQLIAIMPEGSSTTSSNVIYRYEFSSHRWYRHIYPKSFRTIFREPDGTIILGTTDGFVWQLDSGSTDDGAGIDLRIDTKFYDDGTPLRSKNPHDFWLFGYTGSEPMNVDIYLDGNSASATTLGLVNSALSYVFRGIQTLNPFLTMRLKLTGTFTTAFQLQNWKIHYQERPEQILYSEIKPLSPSARRRRFGGFTVLCQTYGRPVKVTPVLDAIDRTDLSVTTVFDAPQSKTITFSSIVGKDLWAKLEGSIL